MIIRRIGILILLGISFTATEAQDKFINDSSDAKDLSQKVADLFKENKITAAVKLLKPYWPIPENEVDEFEEKTIKYLNMIENRVGKSVGTIKVHEETIKDLAIRETYLVKYQSTAIRLIFTYYKSEKGWIINAFKWDENFSEEFK